MRNTLPPRMVAVPDGRVSKRLSGTRALCAGAYHNAARERPGYDFEIEPVGRHGMKRLGHAGANCPHIGFLPTRGRPGPPAYNRSISRILKAIPINSSASPTYRGENPDGIVEDEFAVSEWSAIQSSLPTNINSAMQPWKSSACPRRYRRRPRPLLGVERFARYNLDLCGKFSSALI